MPRRSIAGACRVCVIIAVWAAGPTAVRAPAAPPESGPVRIYVLVGQSNMEGHGVIAADPGKKGMREQGTLARLARDPATAGRFGHLLDTRGNWVVRDDVWISYLDRRAPLTVGFGAKPHLVGPELGFGTVMGDAHADPVLLVKCAWGGRSLAIDFRPPSAGKPAYGLGEKLTAAIAADPDILGRSYRETIRLVKAAIADLDGPDPLVPGAKARGHVLAGFAWHQGWNDRINDAFNGEYEENLAHLIVDIRRDLGVADLPFAIAETGMSGPGETHPRALSLMRAQAAVAARPEFRGTVAFVGTRDFWRPAEESPANNQGYHWNMNAETYYLIGAGLGRALLDLEASRR